MYLNQFEPPPPPGIWNFESLVSQISITSQAWCSNASQVLVGNPVSLPRYSTLPRGDA